MEVVLPGNGRMTYLGEGRFFWVSIQIKYKMNFQDGCQIFFLYFICTFHWMLQVYCITQKMHISQELAFLCGSLFSVMRHNSSVLFHLKLIMLWTKWAHKVKIFRFATARLKIKDILNPYNGLLKKNFSVKTTND